MLAHSKPAPLVTGFIVDDIAEACRSTALELLRGVRSGWGKRELGEWLVGPYHQLSILRFPPTLTRSPFSSGVFPRANVRPHAVREPDVVKVMRDAREEALRVIDRFQNGDPAAETFLWRLQSRGLLARIEDETGARGLVPNEIPRQHLADRLLSLLACDYVSRPLDYQDKVAICRKCGAVTFADHARANRDCGEHVNESGERPRVRLLEMDLDDVDENDTVVREILERIETA